MSPQGLSVWSLSLKRHWDQVGPVWFHLWTVIFSITSYVPSAPISIVANVQNGNLWFQSLRILPIKSKGGQFREKSKQEQTTYICFPQSDVSHILLYRGRFSSACSRGQTFPHYKSPPANIEDQRQECPDQEHPVD